MSVRLVNERGDMVGVVPRNEALAMAADAGLDLVEIAPNADPPVCKILDFGKFRYQQSRKSNKPTKVHQAKIKEIRVRPKTGDHDIETKINQAKRFLEHKDKVLVNVVFRGRELQHIDEGRRIIVMILEQLADCCKVERSMPDGHRFPPCPNCRKAANWTPATVSVTVAWTTVVPTTAEVICVPTVPRPFVMVSLSVVRLLEVKVPGPLVIDRSTTVPSGSFSCA